MSSTNKNEKTQEKPIVNQEEPKADKPIVKTIFNDIKYEILLLEKNTTSKDSKQILKIFKSIRKFKRHLKSHHFLKIWECICPEKNFDFLKGYPDFKADFPENFEITKNLANRLAKINEIDLYLQSLYLIYLVQIKKLDEAKELAQYLIKKVKDINKRYLDYLSSYLYFYYYRVYELLKKENELRNEFYDAYRSACIHKDEIGQATLLNLLLRNLLNSNNYEAAQNLISKTTFPENKSNNEFVRYLYYTGKIKAVQLEYTEAFSRLMQSIRKAPDTSALGFRIQAQKLAIVVELLLGEIPGRTIFSQKEFRKSLFPYFSLVQSVLKGNIVDFKETVNKFGKYFIKDNVFTLVNRLHHVVIKTGLRKINLSYSRISLRDVALKLNLDSNTDVEFIVAKCIRDGVINAKIDHENQHLVMKEVKDFYSTDDPQHAFEKRISYCLNLYNTVTKALQFPNLKSTYAQRERNDEISLEELLRSVEEDDF